MYRIRKDDPSIAWMLPESRWYRGKVTFTVNLGDAAELTDAQCAAYLALPSMHPGAYQEEITPS